VSTGKLDLKVHQMCLNDRICKIDFG